MAADNRTQPHDLYAERAVLGSLLINNNLIADAIREINSYDFFRDAHRFLFEAILRLSERSAPADLVTLTDEVGDRLDACGGMAYISSLLDGVPVSRNIDGYLKIVSRHARSRRLIQTANELMAHAYDGDDPDLLLDQAGQRIFELGIAKAHGKLRPVSEIMPAVLEQLHRQSSAPNSLLGISTGFHQLDKMLGGLMPTDLIIVAARPSMGKTAFVLNVCQNVAAAGKKVAMFSLEMSDVSLVMRLLSSGAMVDGRAMKHGTLTEVEWKRLADYYSAVADQTIHIDETSQMTLLEMRAKCRAMKRSDGLDLIAVDYLQLMPRAGERDMENRNLELAAITRGMKGVAKELNVPLVALSQLSRANEARQNKRPMLSDLRESGAIEQDADVVLFIHREEVYKATNDNAGMAELIIGKQRNGPVGVVKVQWIQEQTRFANIDSNHFTQM